MIEFSALFLFPVFVIVTCYFVKDLRLQYITTLTAAAIHLVLSLVIFAGLYKPDLPYYFSFDSLSRLFLLVLSNVYFWVVLISYTYLKRQPLLHPAAEDGTPGDDAGKFQRAREGEKYYFLLLNFYLLSNTAAILSNHFGMYWVAAEATTLSIAPLIYFYRNEEALEAMWKYLFIVSVGIAFAFLGILFLVLASKGSSLEGTQLFFSEFVKKAKELNPVWLKASFIFIFAGLSTKIGIAPLHTGDVDATSNAPSPIAALMSGSLRITALIGVLRIYQVILPTGSAEFSKFILILGGIFSLSAAFLFMFKINNYKRLLAYSSVEHLGIIALGIGTGGLAFLGAMYHVIYNSINKMVLFFSAGNIHRKYKTRDVDGIHSALSGKTLLPWTGWLFLISFLAISGIPPFGIFFSEIMIFEGMLFSGSPVFIIITLVLLLFIFINMGRTVFRMLFNAVNHEDIEYKQKEKFEFIHLVIIILLVMLSAAAVFSPGVLEQNILSIGKDFGII